MKYKRIRIKIEKYLKEAKEPRSTQEIYEFINNGERYGIQMQALNNVLAKTRTFHKVDVQRIQGISMNTYKGCLWTWKD
jgi:hypothetical protein|tara:strand:- start:805 stop:1041 length:237 start_codon:yes stop_codon:yes gene_type:complete